MAASGDNSHYHWTRILPRHWQATAKSCNSDRAIESILDELVELTPEVLSYVSVLLPADFPEHVSGPIFDGLEAAAGQLCTNPRFPLG